MPPSRYSSRPTPPGDRPPAAGSARARKLHRLLLAGMILLLAAVAFPFLFPGMFVRRWLARSSFHGLQFRSATLSPLGKLTLGGVTLEDSGQPSRGPLLAARTVQVDFAWSQLPSYHLQKVIVDGLDAGLQPGGNSLRRLLQLLAPSTEPGSRGAPGDAARTVQFEQLSINGSVHVEGPPEILQALQVPAAAVLPLRAVVTTSHDHAPETHEVVAVVGDPDAAANSPASNMPVLSTRFRITPGSSTLIAFDVLTLTNISPALTSQWLAGAPATLRRNYTGHLDRLQFSGTVTVGRETVLSLSAEVRDFSAHAAPLSPAAGDAPDPPIGLEHFAAATRIEGKWTANPLKDLTFSHARCTFDAAQYGEWRITRGVADLQNDAGVITLNDLQALFEDSPVSATAAFDINARNFTRARLWLNNVDAARALARLPADLRQAIPVSADGIVGARFFLTESDADHLAGRIELSCPEQLTLVPRIPSAVAACLPPVPGAKPPTLRLSNVALGAAVSWYPRRDALPDIARGRLTADSLELFNSSPRPAGAALESPADPPPSPAITRLLSDFGMSRGLFRLDDLYATLPEGGNLVARATYTLGTRSLFPLTILIENLDASILAPWLPNSLSMTGRFDTDLQLSLSPDTAAIVGTVSASNEFAVLYGPGSLTLSGAPSPTISINAAADLAGRSIQVNAFSMHGLNTVAANADFIQQLRDLLHPRPAEPADQLLNRLRQGGTFSMEDLHLAGRIDLSKPPTFSGPVSIYGVSLRADPPNLSAGAAGALAIDKLSLRADVQIPLGAQPIARDIRIATSQLQADRITVGGLSATRFSGQFALSRGRGVLCGMNFGVDGSTVTGDGVLSPDRGLEELQLSFSGLEQRTLTRQLFPTLFTAEGPVSGMLNLSTPRDGALAGTLQVDADAPGWLRLSPQAADLLLGSPSSAPADVAYLRGHVRMRDLPPAASAASAGLEMAVDYTLAGAPAGEDKPGAAPEASEAPAASQGKLERTLNVSYSLRQAIYALLGIEPSPTPGASTRPGTGQLSSPQTLLP
jgi:hypothetical protein